ncbi:MAG: DUF934 domain-containing protein [Halieaceae bacterium]|jgi:uncharacterized protein (DUF934 family)|nr:DUF934 domain-containing protein [Halieaceae bacterium]
MPKIIKDGAVVDDGWSGQLLDLESYNTAVGAGTAPAEDIGVLLEPGEEPAGIAGDISAIPLIAINFPVFTDGRGFSYARELRQRGYSGEIRAVGSFIRDQLAYLKRCGVNAFAFDADIDLEAALASLQGFSDHYQADVVQNEPLFRRR